MSTAVKLRRGTTAQHSTFTGAQGEVTVDTTKNTAVVHDGSTAGGFPLVKEAAIGVSVQAYDVDTTKNDVANTFTAAQAITVTDNTNAALKVTQNGTAENIRITGGSVTPGKIVFENLDTTISDGDHYGVIQFYGNDATANANGVRSEIRARSTGTTGGSAFQLYIANANSTTLNLAASIYTSNMTLPSYLNAQGVYTPHINNVYETYSWVSMVNTDTQVDVDVTSIFPVNVDNTYLFSADVVGIYNNAGTYARLHKTWNQHIYWNGTTYVLAGAQLLSSYNSDATNFPAGAVNASKVLTVVSTTQVIVRLQNRTSPAAGSTTNYYVKVRSYKAF